MCRGFRGRRIMWRSENISRAGSEKHVSLPWVSRKHGKLAHFGKTKALYAPVRASRSVTRPTTWVISILRSSPARFPSQCGLRSLRKCATSLVCLFQISDRMGKRKMARLDTNPEDHGHLLGHRFGRMPRGFGKSRMLDISSCSRAGDFHIL